MTMPTPAQAETARGYSTGELMVAVASREVRDGELVFVGMRLPLLAFLVARSTHAPAAVGLFENGVIRTTPARELLYTMADPPNLQGATFCGQMIDVMGLLQQGRVGLGFLGAAEVDRFGNLNSTWGRPVAAAIPGGEAVVRLPGSGGACDIACLARRTVVLLRHDPKRLVERVGHVTSPGYGRGNDWRRQQGLPAGSGPAAIITTMGVLRFGADGEAFLASVHPGLSVEDVLAATGWTLRVAENLEITPPPTAAELAALRALDPDGFWTRAQ
jgi:glutaconate CoA-transferase subunit B